MLHYENAFLTVAAIVLVGGAVGALAEDAPPERGVLTVRVSNVQNDKGQIGCSLFKNRDGFPMDADKAVTRIFVKQKAGKATCIFKNVKAGTYAVSVMHDENKDGKMETSMVGRPKEWWGVSKNVPPERFGPPKYEAASFPYSGEAKALDIKLRL